ncbi:MAG: hypothetical protein ABI837_02850 [Acidobacteriota bacterium]
MAQPTTNPKIEELRSRIKADPKSRLFYPLAEELRKISQFAEAEKVLRAGLATHATYLSAWVSLGRVLRDIDKNHEAVEALSKALLLDPGNVVAARLLADAYLALGEKVEAIKKYKLVHALLPSDQEMEATIDALENEILHAAVPQLTAAESLEPEAADELEHTPTAEMPFHDTATSGSPFGTGAESPFAHDAMQGGSGGPSYGISAPSESTPFQGVVGSAADAASVSEAPFPETELQSPLGSPARTGSPFAAEPEIAAVSPAAVVSAAPSFDENPFFQASAAPAASLWDEPVSERAAMPTLATPLPSELREDSREEAHLGGIGTGDAEPMTAKHSESPFEEPADSYSSEAFSLEQPAGMHIGRAPMAADVPSLYRELQFPAVDSSAVTSEPPESSEPEEPYVETGIASDLPFALESTLAPPDADDFAKTITMADLYAGQGLVDEARDIYEDILARDPNNASIRAKLEALDHQPASSPAYAEEEPFEADEESSSFEQPYTTMPEPAAEVVQPVAISEEAEQSFTSGPSRTEELFGVSQAVREDEPTTPSPGQSLSLGAEESESTPSANGAPAFVPAGVDRGQIARLEGWLAKVGKREVSGV